MMVMFTRQRILAVSCAGLLLGAAALAWSPAAWGQGAVKSTPSPQTQQTQPSKIDRTLPRSQTGVLTKAKDGTVSIDRDTYVMAAGALIEKKNGDPVGLRSWEGVAFDVQYWLGTGDADRQITQLIIDFPE